MANTTGSGTVARTQASVTTTNTSTAIGGPAASFSQRDKGAPISGTGIPAAATIATVTDATHAVLSAAATATGTITATIGPRKESVAGFIGWKPETDAQHDSYAFVAQAAGAVNPDRLSDSVTRASEPFEH